MERLRLAAFDSDDLAVISAHLQDAVLTVGDLHWLASQHRFVLYANRFDRNAGTPARRRTALSFTHVSQVRAQRIAMSDRTAVLSLLAVTFVESDPPSGEIVLTFSGGGEIRLTAECIEAVLADSEAIWATAHEPRHALDPEGHE